MPENEEHINIPFDQALDELEADKKRMLTKLMEARGIVLYAAKAANIGYSTHYHWMKNDPLYAKCYEMVVEACIDFVEGKLLENIEGVLIEGEDGVYKMKPDTTALIFFLKTRAKKRGYVERNELTGADGKDLSPQIIVNNTIDATRVNNT